LNDQNTTADAAVPISADTAAPPADDRTPPPGRTLSRLQVLRNALRARVTGVRAHLEHAQWGDHRATASALRMLTDLVADMLGPDTPEDSLRGALSDLTAGRTEDARKSMEAARETLRAQGMGIEAGWVDKAVALIAAAEATLLAGDRADAQSLIERALAVIEAPGG
jgi:hypothetical protein